MTEPSDHAMQTASPAPGLPGRTRTIDLLWILLVIVVGLAMAGVASVLIGLAAGTVARVLAIDVSSFQIDLMQGAVVASILVTAAVFGFGGLWLARRRGVGARALGFRGTRWLWFAAALVLAVLFYFADGLVTQWIDPSGEVSRQMTGSFLLLPSPLWVALVAIAIGPATATAEEILFRGLLYRWFRERIGVPSAALLSAVLFAASHLYFVVPGGFPGEIMTLEIVVFGVIAAGLYQASGSLWPSILFHALNNASVVLTAVLPPGS
jgi:membrane protease YdiL (CAAX protease family)